MRYQPISPSHFPDIDTFLQTPAQAIVIARLNLAMGQDADTQVMPSLNGHDMLRAYGLATYAEDCYETAALTAERAQELLEEHDHQRDNCVPDDCQADAYAQEAKKIIEKSADLSTGNQLLQAEVTARNKNTPITAEEVDEASADHQMAIRLNHATRLANNLTDRSSTASSQERQATALALEYLAMAHTGRPCEFCQHDTDEQTAVEDSEEKEARRDRAYQQQETIEEMAIPHITKVNEAMPVKLSQSLNHNHRLHRWLQMSHSWLGIPEPGIHLSKRAKSKLQDLENHIADGNNSPGYQDILNGFELDPDTGEYMEAFISYVHDGQRHLKAVQDPYPTGFPQNTAMYHIHLVQDVIQEAWNNGTLSMPASYILQNRTHDAYHMANAMLHDIPAADLDSVADTARSNGAPDGTVALIMNVITQDNARAVAPEPGQSHRWWQRETTLKQAKATVEAAKELGLDHNALTSIGTALGYSPNELDIQYIPLSDPAIDSITERAREIGIPDDTLEHLAHTLRISSSFN